MPSLAQIMPYRAPACVACHSASVAACAALCSSRVTSFPVEGWV